MVPAPPARRPARAVRRRAGRPPGAGARSCRPRRSARSSGRWPGRWANGWPAPSASPSRWRPGSSGCTRRSTSRPSGCASWRGPVAGLVVGGVLAVGARLSGPGRPRRSWSAGRRSAFLVVEQQLAGASARWQRRIFLELPVVAEQLGHAARRRATRWALPCPAWPPAGTGACGRDLVRVTGRIRQGLTEVEALREWAAVADVEALRRLVERAVAQPPGRRPRPAHQRRGPRRSAATCTAS